MSAAHESHSAVRRASLLTNANVEIHTRNHSMVGQQNPLPAQLQLALPDPEEGAYTSNPLAGLHDGRDGDFDDASMASGASARSGTHSVQNLSHTSRSRPSPRYRSHSFKNLNMSYDRERHQPTSLIHLCGFPHARSTQD
jgi:hypothetical protein